MTNQKLLLSLITISILSTACSNKKCVGEDKHDGLYNALTCNYQGDIASLQFNLNAKIVESNRLFHDYQKLIARVTNKELELTQVKNEIMAINNNVSSLKNLLEKSKNTKIQALTILKLKSQLKQLNMSILNKSTFFTVEDASFTKQKLLSSNDKAKYAEAFNKDLLQDKEYTQSYDKNLLKDKAYAKNYHKNLLKEKEYAKAYQKNLLQDSKYAEAYKKSPKKTFALAYKKDIKNDKKLRATLSSKIEAVQKSLSSTNFSNSKSSINTLIKNIKIYTNSLTRILP